MQQIAVIGAGTMGRGIIETAVVHGLSVDVVEPDAAQQLSAVSAIEMSIARGIKRGRIDLTNPDAAIEKITWHRELAAAVEQAATVIEAVPESESLKVDLFGQLGRHCGPEVILASNTSSVSITRLGAAAERPERVIGMHFFNPVPIMQPVEVVRGIETAAETVERTCQLAETMGKQPFAVQDSPGFVVNRVLMPLINEAVFALQENIADRETIDALMKLGCNHPMGPLELADFIGLDVCLSILQVLYQELGDPKFHPCPLLTRTVAAGHLGRKTGRGFYEYQRPQSDSR